MEVFLIRDESMIQTEYESITVSTEAWGVE